MRVIVHLQDVRIIALGVSIDKPSLFVNANAHLVLHPPLLRGADTDDRPIAARLSHGDAGPERAHGRMRSTTTPPSMVGSSEAYYPLVRSISPNGPHTTSYGLSDGPMPSLGSSSSAAGPSVKRSLARVMPRTRRLSSWNGSIEESDEPGSGPSASNSISTSPPSSSRTSIGGMLSLNRTRSRDKSPSAGGADHNRRAWSFARPRAGSDGYVITAEDMGVPPLPVSHGPLTPVMPTLAERELPDSPPSPNLAGRGQPLPPTPPKTPVPAPSARLPYAPLRKPLPAPGFRLYPNYTPVPAPASAYESLAPAQTQDPEGCTAVRGVQDTRQTYEEVEDDSYVHVWGGDDMPAWSRMAEWDSAGHARRRWVGPMVLFAQLFPTDRSAPHPPGVDQSGPVEGPGVDLGPKGMYASLGFEDLDRLLPWVELKGGGGNSAEARRAGLGFDSTMLD